MGISSNVDFSSKELRTNQNKATRGVGRQGGVKDLSLHTRHHITKASLISEPKPLTGSLTCMVLEKGDEW